MSSPSTHAALGGTCGQCDRLRHIARHLATSGSFPPSAAYIRRQCTHGWWASTATPLCCFSVRQQSPASHWRSSLGRRGWTCPSSGWQRLQTRCELLHIECANSRARRGMRSDSRSPLWCATSSRPRPNRCRFGPGHRSALRQLAAVIGPEGAGVPLHPRMDEQEAGAWERSLECYIKPAVLPDVSQVAQHRRAQPTRKEPISRQ